MGTTTSGGPDRHLPIQLPIHTMTINTQAIYKIALTVGLSILCGAYTMALLRRPTPTLAATAGIGTTLLMAVKLREQEADIA